MKYFTADSRAPQAVARDIVVHELGDETLVYKLKTHRAMTLNSTVACVWELCNGKNSLSEIQKLAEIKLKSPVPEEAITLAIDELQRNDLLITNENSDFSKDMLSGLSRRALIKKVGMGTAIAIPLITAITAPAAIAAASTKKLPDGSPCVDDSECTNTCCLGNVCLPSVACTV